MDYDYRAEQETAAHFKTIRFWGRRIEQGLFAIYIYPHPPCSTHSGQGMEIPGP